MIKAFAGARGGNFAVHFALAVPLLLACATLAVDYSRALTAKSHATDAADAATLAAASQLARGEIERKEARELAKTYFLAQISQSPDIAQDTIDAAPPKVEIMVDEEGGAKNVEVRLTASGRVATTFWHLGNGGLDYSIARSSVSASETSSALSLALVLDQSGSMAQCTLHRDQLGHLNLSEMLVIYFGSSWDGDFVTVQNAGFCAARSVPTRMVTLKQAVANLGVQLTEADPEQMFVRTGATSYAEDFKAMEPMHWGTQRTVGFVSRLNAGGNTGSSEAFAKAYNALMRDQEIFAHRERNGQEPARAILFMTDGENNLDGEDEATLRTCEDAREDGVVIYSVAFEAPPKGQSLLRACAGKAENYFEAANASELISAFKEIGTKAADLMVRVAR